MRDISDWGVFQCHNGLEYDVTIAQSGISLMNGNMALTKTNMALRHVKNS